MNDVTLELSGVSRRFGDVIAVDDVSLAVRRGETVALLGPNGAGQTTLLEMMLGLRRPDRGAIRARDLDGEGDGRRPRRRDAARGRPAAWGQGGGAHRAGPPAVPAAARTHSGDAPHLELTLVIWLAATAFTALGVLIGLAIADPEAAQSATSAALIGMWLFGGLVTSPSDLPGALETLADGMPPNAAGELGSAAARGDAVPLSAIAVLGAWTAAVSALATLAWRRLAGAR